jgi:hypothetical protein
MADDSRRRKSERRALNILVLDEAFVSGTMTAIGLARAGCTVRVLAAAGGVGRSSGRNPQWELGPRTNDHRLLPLLDEIVRRQAIDVVYPVTEPLQQLIWNTAPAWSDRVFPAWPEWQRALLVDKQCMSAHMARAGLQVPDERPASTDGDVQAGVSALGLPVVVKGSSGRGGAATIIADSVDAARIAARRIRSRGMNAFLQSYVNGPTFLAGGLFDRGEALRFYAGEKTVQFPSRTGPAAELLSTGDASFVAAARAAFQAAGVSGLASVDFIRDERGQFQFLELNPRPWGSMAAVRDAGSDLFSPLVGMWSGNATTPCLEYEIGKRSPVFPLYLFSGRYWRSGRALTALESDAGGVLRLARQNPSLALHFAHRLLRVGLNWSKRPN